MKMQQIRRSAVSLLLAVALCAGLPAGTLALEYNDFEYITSHVALGVPSSLAINRPTQDIDTMAQNYYLTGSSNPELPLTLNGEEVTGRGARGSFGMFVALSAGEDNVFTFRQGDKSAQVVISQGKQPPAATTKAISRMAPEFDCAGISGTKLKLSCVAPSGAQVTARVGERTIELRQAAATAQKGVPATFTGELTAPGVNGTKSLGQVTYVLNGEKSFTSAGAIFVAEALGALAVQVDNGIASIYKDAQQSAFIETAKDGAVDVVTDMTATMYKLATGGWVKKEAVQPLTKVSGITLDVEDFTFVEEADGAGEMLTLTGAGRPMFRAYFSSGRLNLKLFNTAFSAKQAQALEKEVLERSRVFSGVQREYEGEDLILTFILSDTSDRALWGYEISYGADGGFEIYTKYAPNTSNGNQPLKGITIAVDAGHGGTDPGALGIPLTGGATESEINLAAAIAVQKRLEGLGATVLMCRTDESDVTMNRRMADTFAARADLFISLHCNSIGYDVDASKPSGTEVYYYENIAKGLAERLSANVSGYTGRKNRGAKFSNFRVTMNTCAPSVLVEMGFLTNAAEYDEMTTRKGIYNTANAVGDAVLATLG